MLTSRIHCLKLIDISLRPNEYINGKEAWWDAIKKWSKNVLLVITWKFPRLHIWNMTFGVNGIKHPFCTWVQMWIIYLSLQTSKDHKLSPLSRTLKLRMFHSILVPNQKWLSYNERQRSAFRFKTFHFYIIILIPYTSVISLKILLRSAGGTGWL